VALTGAEFLGALRRLSRAWLPARSIVEEAINARASVDESGKIVVLSQFCPWKSHLLDLEDENNIKGHILYVVYGDSGGDWRVQAVAQSEESFQSRKALPEPWRGKRDAELSSESGIADCVFVRM
jgi:uncharacterized UPF0160 family protein